LDSRYAGNVVVLNVLRDQTVVRVKIKLASLATQIAQPNVPYIGVSFGTVTNQSDEFATNPQPAPGVYVTNLDSDGPLGSALPVSMRNEVYGTGIQVIEIDGVAVTSALQAYEEVLQSGYSPVQLVLRSGGNTTDVTITPIPDEQLYPYSPIPPLGSFPTPL
jgi:hypothetical protein